MKQRRFPRAPRRALRAGAAGLVLAMALAACSHGSGSGHRSSSTPTSGTAPQPSSGASTATSTRPAGPAPTARTSPKARSRLSTVASVPVTTLPPVPIRRPAAFGTGLSVQVTGVAHGVSKASGRGALGGRATVTLTLVLRNGSTRAVTVNTVQVTATYGAARTPAVPSDDSGTKNFGGSLGGGKAATGVYRFLIPKADQDNVNVTVWYRSGVPTVLLRGSVQ